MANAIYPTGKQALLEGSIHWINDTIKVVLVTTSIYVYNPAHVYVSALLPGNDSRLGIAQALAGKTSVGGVADANDVTFLSVQGIGYPAGALVIFKDVGPGDLANSPLIAYIDTCPGLPFSPTGADVVITWDNGANKIFKL